MKGPVLYLAAQDLKSRGVNTVWVPALICDVVPVALSQGGLKVQYYPLSPDLLPDFSWLDTQQLSGAFLYVNYFGLSQTWRPVKAWASEKKMTLIADHAHSFLDFLEDVSGVDYAVTSYGKILGSKYGGLFRSRNKLIETPKMNYSLRREVSNLLSWMPPFIDKWRGNLKPTGSAFKPSLVPGGVQVLASPVSARLSWRLANSEKIVAARRKSFAQVWEVVSSLPELSAFQPWSKNPLEIGDCPWFFPLFVPYHSGEKACSNLLNAGVEAFIWPQLPSDLPSDLRAGFSHEILAIPIWKEFEASSLKPCLAKLI